MLNIVGLHVHSTLANKINKVVVKYLDLNDFGIKNIAYDEKLYWKKKLEEEIIKEQK